jgi:DNA-binding transcriptional MerR regulator
MSVIREFLNVSATARRLHLSSDRIRQLARAGSLRVAATTSSGERLFEPDDVAAFEERRREKKSAGEP